MHLLQKMEQKSPERVEKMMELKDDPELKDVFEDIASNGPAAMEKYWNDTDLMSKIAKKMSALNVGPETPPRTAEPSEVGPYSLLHSPQPSLHPMTHQVHAKASHPRKAYLHKHMYACVRSIQRGLLPGGTVCQIGCSSQL